VPGDIVESFLGGKEEIVPEIGWDGKIRELFGEIDAAPDSCRLEEVHCVLSDVAEEVSEGVISWIDGPDDFLERFDSAAGGCGDVVYMGLEFFGVGAVIPGQVAEQSDLGEACPEVVVDVFCDAGAFLLDCGFAFEVGEPSLERAERSEADETYNKQCG